jgi:hypothetical protein
MTRSGPVLASDILPTWTDPSIGSLVILLAPLLAAACLNDRKGSESACGSAARWPVADRSECRLQASPPFHLIIAENDRSPPFLSGGGIDVIGPDRTFVAIHDVAVQLLRSRYLSHQFKRTHRGYYPRQQRLNFFPLPHGHGSFR